MSATLEHVYWIGGGNGAGKSTMAKRLADEYNLYLYDTDKAMTDHGARANPDQTPYLQIFKEMDMNDRWVNRTPQEMFETFHWYKGEGFDLIIEDLINLPSDRPIIVEGFRLLPRHVKPFVKHLHQAVWLLPTDDFRKHAFENRGTLWDIPNKTNNPEQALTNLLTRDGIFTRFLESEIKETGLSMITVDVTMTKDDLFHRIATQFFN